MNHDEHVARHRVLHEALDEIVADYLRWNPGRPSSDVTVEELIEWSYKQTLNPSEDGPDTVHTYSVCAHCGNEIDGQCFCLERLRL